MSVNSTIAALATPAGRGGVAVIRLSGPQSWAIAQQLTGQVLPAVRKAVLRTFYDEYHHSIDQGLLICFEAPHSFTGEDVVELHGHGGPVVANLLLQRTYALGASPAAPGEFSARAFENDKLDLAQAEAIADLIDASSQAAVRSAMRSLQGDFSAHIQHLLDALITVRLHVEAAIDFPEEEIDFLADGQILAQISHIQTQLDTVLASARQGQLLREGLQVVIAGQPNAGKSSLLNVLAGMERAIVTDIAGTTRDILQEKLVLAGLPINLVDTAGLRETQDIVEQEGIRRALLAIDQADLLLYVYDQTQEQDPLATARQFFAQQATPQRLILIANKADLAAVPIQSSAEGYRQVSVSAKLAQGLDQLIAVIHEHAHFQPSEDAFIARSRHLDAIRRCAAHVAAAREQLEVFHAGELVAESLRCAQQALAEITGQFTADDLLGKIFSSFCIGK